MKILLKTDEKIIFTTDITSSLANSIRRSVYSIPTLAVDELEIEKNDTALYDETLAHRVGLTPLKMPKDCKEDTVIKLKLNVKQPGYVYSKDLKGDCEVAYGGVPLTLLTEGHEVKATAIAKMGIGKDHAKFLPGIILYRDISEITLPKKYKEIVSKTFPDNVIKEKDNKIIIKDDAVRTVIDFCEGLCRQDNEEYETKDGKELMITVESFGQMSPEEIFKKAVNILKDELADFVKSF